MFTVRSTFLDKICVKICNSVPTKMITDENKMKQIIVNIVGNSLKYTPSGEIFVWFEVKQEKENKIRVEIRVKDSGVGISKEDQVKLFTPFSRFHRQTHVDGTGLGLCISKTLSNAMNGDILCRSEPGIGSEFTFFFIIDGVLSKDYEEVNIEFNKSYLGQKEFAKKYRIDIKDYTVTPNTTILIVDDIRVNKMVLKKQLEKIGALVELADNWL